MNRVQVNREQDGGRGGRGRGEGEGGVVPVKVQIAIRKSHPARYVSPVEKR